MPATRPLTTFHPFSRLPKEIRIQIWKIHLTSMEPRIVTIRSDKPRDYNQQLQYFHSSDPVPSILHACQESRLEALPFYVAAFTNGLNPRYTWTNFHHDTINLHNYDLCKLSYLDKARIRQLVVESGSADYFIGECRGEFEPMKDLARLEILTPQFLFTWDQLIGWMRRDFTRWFGHIPEYVCPEIRIIQRGTQWELNVHNYEAFIRVEREQNRIARGGGIRGLPGAWRA